MRNVVLRHLCKGAITFVTKVFNAVLCRKYFSPAWKQAGVVPILKPGRDPMLPSSYRPMSLLDAVDKLIEKILLTRVFREVKRERGTARQAVWISTQAQLDAAGVPPFVERVNRYVDESRVIGTLFLYVAKTFDTVWVRGLLMKLTVLNFLSYVAKTMSSYLDCLTFHMSFQSATYARHVMRADVA
jgi:hypothetical protein